MEGSNWLWKATGLPEPALRVLSQLGAPLVLSVTQTFTCTKSCHQTLGMPSNSLRLHALAWIHMNGLDNGPPLDGLEMFSGVETITSTLRARGFAASPFDLDRDKRLENLMSTRGFLGALIRVRHLRPQALFWTGTPCSTWVRQACQHYAN